MGVDSSTYWNFKEISKSSGARVLAEQFDVSDETSIRLSSGVLEALVRRIRAGEKFGVQGELSRLCPQQADQNGR